MPSQRLSKIDILSYALEGAYTIRGVNSGQLDEEDEEALDKDIQEIEQRLANAQAKATKRVLSGKD